MFDDLILQLRQDRYDDGVKERNNLLYGYGRCENKTELWLRAIEILRAQYIAGTVCICEKEVSDIFYGAKQYLGMRCGKPDLDYVKSDRSDINQWIVSNPDCVVYEYWVDSIKAECARVGIDLKVVESECAALDLDIKVVYEKVCDDLQLHFIVEEIKCDLGIDITVEEVKQCKLDYDVKIVPLDCDLSLNVVTKAVACGVEMDVIVKEVNCGMTLNVTAEGVNFCPASVIEIETEPPVGTISCLFCDDTNYAPDNDRVLRSLIVDDVVYYDENNEVLLDFNSILIGDINWNTGLADAINDVGLEHFYAEYPSEADFDFIDAIDHAGVNDPKPRNSIRIVYPFGSTFEIVVASDDAGTFKITESKFYLLVGDEWQDFTDAGFYPFGPVSCVTE